MASVPLIQLRVARKYPFSTAARNVMKQLSPQMGGVDPEIFERAIELVLAATTLNARQQRTFIEQHVRQKDVSYEEFVKNDVLAFPVAKILLSLAGNRAWQEKFAALMGDLTFEYLANEKDRLATFLDLAQDLKLRVDFQPIQGNTQIRISLPQYVMVPFQDAQLHLPNQRVDSGFVVLETNLASRWLAEAVAATILASLPVETKGLPPLFAEKSHALQKRIRQAQVEATQKMASGVVNLPAFPPCMDKLYNELNSGVNLPHMARFDLATFLVNIEMPQEDIVGLFAKAPNYDERITRYHVDNLSGKHSGKKYSAPSCAKVREHGLCISRTCNVAHPLQFYARESNPSTATVKAANKENNATVDAAEEK